MKKDHFDLIVVGGGTAGLRTALYAASHNHTVALIDPGVLGGTCHNTGCIPTKAMLHASHLFASTKSMKEFGINIASSSVDFKALMNRVHSIIDEGQSHISSSIQNDNLTVIREKASFVSKDTVQAGPHTLSADKFIICTGAKPRIPALKGIEKVKYLLSDDILSLQSMPESIIIIGGGYIALEFATFFNDLGCKVTIVERNPLILKDLDSDVIELLTKKYTSEGIKLKTNAEVLEMSEEKGMKKVKYSIVGDGVETAVAQHLLIATGRAPFTFGLNLEAAGIKVGDKGNIEVNEYLQTSNPRVFAIGDVTGKAPFAHAAKRESHIALINALETKKEKFNTALVPWAIFTSPPVGGIGLSEREVIERKLKYGVLKAPFSRAGRATVIGSILGFVKILYDKKTDKIIGGTVVGPNADDIIHEIVALMNAGGTTQDLRNTIHIHPTLSEVFEALKDVTD